MAVLLHGLVNASSPMWKAVPEYGAMATLDAAATVHINLLDTIVLWVAAAAIVVVYGALDLSRRPRQIAGRGEKRSSRRRADRSEGGRPT